MQSYTTIQGTATTELCEKHSRFIANVSFADTDEKAVEFLNSIKKQHPTATHNVYAYMLRSDARTRYSDDGEPAKTAGMPVLEVIRHSDITNIIVVVTRYFGGTLLGTGGLVRAYTTAAQMGIEAAQKVSLQVCVKLSICIDYALYDSVMYILQNSGAKIEPVEYFDKIKITFTVLNGTQQAVIDALTQLTKGTQSITQSQPFYDVF